MLEYTASGNIPIRVGQSAKENDQLTNTSDPKYWWMHVSGSPGAHVVDLVRVENVTLEGKVVQLTIFRNREIDRLERLKKYCITV